jgi:L-aspartate oxidase
MGGVVTDAHGRSNIKGLWACGEVANTGLHGANRLASNSLLEAASFGARVAEDVKNVSPSGSSVSVATTHSINQTNATSTAKIRSIMSQHVGVLRDQAGLMTAITCLTPMAQTSDMALVGLMIATSALQRKESRGAHARIDYPTLAEPAQRSNLTLGDLALPEYKIGA